MEPLEVAAVLCEAAMELERHNASYHHMTKAELIDHCRYLANKMLDYAWDEDSWTIPQHMLPDGAKIADGPSPGV